MKNVLKILTITMIVFVGFNASAYAEESEDQLTLKEKEYLLHVAGFTEEGLSLLPVDVARDLVMGEAKEIDSTFIELEDNITGNSGLITPYAVIPASNLTIHTPKVIEINSDMAGYNRFLITTGFDWNSQPVWTLTDKLAIGFPDNLGVVLKASGGNVSGFYSRYYMRNPNTNFKIYSDLVTATQDWNNSAGVAASYKLSPQVPLQNTRHGGLIGQEFYIKNTSHGVASVKIEYGHKKVGGSVTIGIFPAGLGISPSANTDTRNYALNFAY